MKIDVLTLFPEMFSPVTEASILGKAAEKEILEINIVDIRDYTTDKHRRADDTPFGGGAGMVMSAQPVFDALRAVKAENKRIIYMSPRGRILDKTIIQELSAQDELVLLCGHYEGIDQRIIDAWHIEEISIGDYILTGGELAAMVVIDTVARFVEGVLGNERAHDEESIYSGLLEYDQYTKPRIYEDFSVPEVLWNGNHKLIHLWQWACSLRLTKKRRPDLFNIFLQQEKSLSKEEAKILKDVMAEEAHLDES